MFQKYIESSGRDKEKYLHNGAQLMESGSGQAWRHSAQHSGGGASESLSSRPPRHVHGTKTYMQAKH